MTRTEYTALAREAEARYEHLRYTLQHDIDIVFVVSRDVYQAMVGYEPANTLVNFAADTVDIATEYMGVPLCCINEDAEEFFMPVVYSQHFNHHNGVQVGDYVLFNDENNGLLYRLVRLVPETMYTDTGLTVSFVNYTIPTTNYADVAAAVAANAATETNLTATAVTEDTIGQALDRFAEAWNELGLQTTFAGEALGRAIGWEPQYMAQWQTGAETAESVRVKRKKRTQREEELNPGDTALLDEYLGSYLRGGA